MLYYAGDGKEGKLNRLSFKKNTLDSSQSNATLPINFVSGRV